MKIVALQIDLARQKENIEYIKSYADFAKANGYNTMFLYLEASVRTSITEFFDKEHSYSMVELKEIVDYIEGLGLMAVPAFENLYHMEKFLQYDELAHLSEFSDATKEGRGWAPVYYPRGSVACASNPAVNEFMDAYIKEICTLFNGEYIHMGLDEIFEFAECERCKERINNGETKKEMFYKHTMHCYELVKSLGKKMMMWSDFFEYYYIVEDLPRDIILCHWEYSFVGEEPKGHWTNRVKLDWLRIFDELGFEYMVCNWTTSASTILNLDTLNNYASKFKPLGRLFTAWERESRFYEGNMPCMAYAGRLWSGKVENTYEDKVSVYSEYLGGSTEFAKAVLAVQVKEGYSGYFNVAHVAETPYAARYIYNSAYRYIIGKMSDELEKISADKTVASVIYHYLYEQLQLMDIVELGNYIFDCREKGNLDIADINCRIDIIKSNFEHIKSFEEKLWQKLRPNIKSNHNAFDIRWNGYFKMLENIRSGLNTDMGILYADLMVSDCHSSVKGEIFVQYEGEPAPVSVHKGAIKPSIHIFELGGCYGFRIAIECKKVSHVIFDVYGEGSVCPLHFCVLTEGKKHHPVSVTKLYGKVENEDKVLLPDTTFALMGYERGIDHLNNGELWKIRSGIKCSFKY